METSHSEPAAIAPLLTIERTDKGQVAVQATVNREVVPVEYFDDIDAACARVRRWLVEKQ